MLRNHREDSRLRTVRLGVAIFAIPCAFALCGCPGVDTDGDGVLDQNDNCIAASNSDQANADGDSLGDACDNCPNAANDDQADSDADGIGDACDNCPATANAGQADADADGLGDVCDNCPNDTNADQSDGDADGVGDACDNCPNDVNVDQADADADGVGDVCDNCPNTPNPDQADANDDGEGDACRIGDLVMADKESDRVYIYYDVLNNGPNQSPDVILDDTTSLVDGPRTVDVGNCLVVGNVSNNTVTIYDDFLNLTTNQAPDVVLDTGASGINGPLDVQVFDGDLFVACRDSDTVLIFRDVASIIAGGIAVAPNVTLNNATSLIDRPIGLTVVADTLYVANEDDDTVTIYNDVDMLGNGDAPNVTLDAVGSLLDNPKRVTIIDNRLFVSNEGPEFGSMSAYSPADGLTDGQAPEFTIGAPAGARRPLSAAIAGGRLWIGQNRNPGLIGFNNPNNPAIFADVMIGDFSHPPLGVNPSLAGSDEIASFNNTLWGASGWSDDEPYGLGAVYGYLDPAHVVSQQLPDTVLFHPTMVSPRALVIAERP